MITEFCDEYSRNNYHLPKIKIEKYVDYYCENITIDSLLTYTIILENICDTDLESVCVIENIISGLRYKLNTLKINGIIPFGGDIDLNKTSIIPIGIIRARVNSRIIITFDVIVEKMPCHYPIFNIARVAYKYSVGEKILSGIETSNKVSNYFKITLTQREFLKLVDNNIIIGKKAGSVVTFNIIIQPTCSINNVLLYDYIDDNLQFISAKVIKNGVTKEIDSSNNINLGYINNGERVDVLIEAKIKESQIDKYCEECDSKCKFISNKATIKYSNPYDNSICHKQTNDVYIYVYNAYINGSKSVDKSRVNIGDIVTYKIDLKHCGSSLIENIILKDLLPKSLEYVPYSALISYNDCFFAPINYDLQTGIMKIPFLDLGENISIYIKAKVVSAPDDGSNRIVNNAYVTYSYLVSPQSENPDDRYYTIYNQLIYKAQPIYINTSDLLSTLEKRVISDCGSCSCDSIDYNISFTNTGNIVANNVIIEDIISNANLDINSLAVTTNKPPGLKPYQGDLPIITISEVYPGESINISFSALVNNTSSEVIVSNYAKISYQYYTCDGQLPITKSGQSNTTNTRVSSARITSEFDIDGFTEANITVGKESLFKILIKNVSSSDLTNVVYKLNLSPGAENYIRYKENSLIITGGSSPTANINPNVDPIQIGTIKPDEFVIIEFIEIGTNITPKPIFAKLEGMYSFIESGSLITCTNSTNTVSLNVNDKVIELSKQALSYCFPNQLGCVVKEIDSVSAGERITYRTTIKNISDKTLEDVTFDDILPPGFTYVEGTLRINGLLLPEDLVPNLNLANIPPDTTRIIEFDVIVDSRYPLDTATNTACVQYFYLIDQTTCKRVRDDDCATNTINVFSPDLVSSFKKSVEEIDQEISFSAPGENIDYIIQFANAGNQDALKVLLSDTLPDNVSFLANSLEITPPVPPQNISLPTPLNRVLQIKFDTVPKDQAYTIKYSVSINSDFLFGRILNDANLNYSYISGSTGGLIDENITSNEVLTNVRSVQLEVTKNASPGIADINSPIDYTVVIKNTGNVTANNIFVIDLLPGLPVKYIEGSLKVNGVTSPYNIETGVLVGTLGVYNPAADSPKAVITYQLISNSVPEFNPIENIANVTYTFVANPNTGEEITNSTTSNISRVLIRAADLVLVNPDKSSNIFTVSNIDPAKNSGTYTIALFNSGNTPAINVKITDKFPPGLNFVEGSVVVKGFDEDGKEVPLEVDSIPPGGPLNIENGILVREIPPLVGVVTTFGFITNGTVSGNIDNRAIFDYSYIVTDTIVNKPNNNTNIATIRAIEDLLEVFKYVSPESYCPGQTLLYSVDINNVSGGRINDVILQDTIPSGVSLIPGTFQVNLLPFTVNGATVTQQDLINGVDLGSIPIGERRFVQYQVVVSDTNAPESITNTSAVEFVTDTIPSLTYRSSITANLSDNCSIVPPTTNFVKMDKEAYSYCEASQTSCTPTIVNSVTSGDRITYNVNINNTGTVSISNVSFSDLLPPRVTFINNTIKVNGETILNATPELLSLDNIEPGLSSTVQFDVVVNSIPNNTSIINISNTNYQYFINCPDCSVVDGISTATNVLNVVDSADLLSTFRKYINTIGTTISSSGTNATIPYIIQFTNVGNKNATNVVLKDTIPDTLEFISGSTQVAPPLPNTNIIEPTETNPVLQINIGTVPSTQSYTIRFDARVKPNITTGTIVNVSNLTYDYISPNGTPVTKSGNSNITTTNIASANLQLIKKVSVSETDINNPVIYTIDVINNGNIIANNIFVKDLLPPFVEYIPNSLRLNGVTNTSNINDGVLVGTLAPYNQVTKQPVATITFDVVATTVPKTNPILNVANASYTYIPNTSTGEEIMASSQSNVESLSVVAADLVSITPTKVSNPKVLSRKDINSNKGTYTVTLFNSGNTDALNVKVYDTLPNGITFITNSVTVVGTDSVGNNVSLTVNSIPPGRPLNIESGISIATIPALVRVDIKYRFKVDSNAPNQVKNIAYFDYSYITSNTIVNKPGNNTNEDILTIVDNTIEVNKTISPKFPCPGHPILYTIVIKNTSSQTLENIILQDTIPQGTCFNPCSFTVNGIPYNLSDRCVDEDICIDENILSKGVYLGDLEPNSTIVVQYQLMISKRCYESPIINTANIYYFIGEKLSQKFSSTSIATIPNSCSNMCNICKDCSNKCNDNFSYDSDFISDKYVKRTSKSLKPVVRKNSKNFNKNSDYNNR